ncbi:MAG: ATP-binding cassette domain-containing protein [Bryobacterales bacterium]|nr:ATP-binding cassette domain-containing protein [Bryobacterales bacterium]
MNELWRVLRYSRPYFGFLLISIILMAVVGGSQGATALLIKPVFDRVLNPSAADDAVKLFTIPLFDKSVYLADLFPAGSIHNVWTMVAISILAVFLLKGVCEYGATYFINYVGLSAVMDLRQDVFNKVLRQDAEFFETHTTGRLMSSIMNDIDKIQVATSNMLADWLRQNFTVLALLAVVLQTDWKLALVSLTVLPFVLVPTARIGRRIRRTSRQAQDHTAELNQVLQETLSGQQVVKAFGGEQRESGRFARASRRMRATSLKYILQQAIASPMIEFFGALTIVGLLYYGREQIKAGGLSAGSFASFLMALLLLYEPVKRLTGIHNIFQQALGASQKVFEYLDQQERIADKPGARTLDDFRQRILFDNISFRYPASPNGFLLDSLTLEVDAGEVVALVGASGAGKSTLVSLLPRFYDVTSGRITVDGTDIRDLSLASLRARIGIVAQDTFLFNDTVLDNIRYGRRDATLEEVRAAAASALADEFVDRLPEGYNTIIGERGAKLSGGQRQRIAIARALLKNAPILILDEATSHLDTESEILVQQALANLMANRTVIVIAHRLSTIRRADKIVVLDHGRISETGSHQELVSGGGIYQRLHDLQFLEPDPLVNP